MEDMDDPVASSESERILHLGIEFEDDDEPIRKVVGREESGEGEGRVSRIEN